MVGETFNAAHLRARRRPAQGHRGSCRRRWGAMLVRDQGRAATASRRSTRATLICPSGSRRSPRTAWKWGRWMSFSRSTGATTLSVPTSPCCSGMRRGQAGSAQGQAQARDREARAGEGRRQGFRERRTTRKADHVSARDGTPPGDRRAHQPRQRRRPALLRLGVHAPLAVEKDGGGDIGYVHLGGPWATTLSRGARAASTRCSTGRPDHRRPPQPRREHRQLDPLAPHAQGVVLLAAAGWRADVGTCSTPFAATSRWLCDESTASDGEAFTEGIKRLKLGKVFGMRTWGGRSGCHRATSSWTEGLRRRGGRGLRAEGQWLIEGHGVDPDVVVDNPPRATLQRPGRAARRGHEVPQGKDQGRAHRTAQGPAASQLAPK